jgi:hypothetical protein
MSRSIFGRLNKWATRQSENFLTESLLALLDELRTHDPELFGRLLSHLTGDFLQVAADQAREVLFISQSRHELGQPDIEIRFRNRRAVIEVKDESPLGERQLERYRVASQSQTELETVLIALTRHVLGEESVSAETADRAVRWIEIGEWLDDQLHTGRVRSPIAQYVARQFYQFLTEKGLAMQRVEDGLSAGIQPLKNLIEMLQESLRSLNIKATAPSMKLPYAVGISLDCDRFHVGIRFEEPNLLQFRTYRFAVDPERAKSLDFGQVYDSEFPNDTLGPHRWRNVFDVSDANRGFFEASKFEQVRLIEQFLSDSLRNASQIERQPE